MHVTLRRLRCHPAKAEQVGRVIETEFVPQLEGVHGVISYALVGIGDDEVASLGLWLTLPKAAQDRLHAAAPIGAATRA